MEADTSTINNVNSTKRTLPGVWTITKRTKTHSQASDQPRHVYLREVLGITTIAMEDTDARTARRYLDTEMPCADAVQLRHPVLADLRAPRRRSADGAWMCDSYPVRLTGGRDGGPLDLIRGVRVEPPPGMRLASMGLYAARRSSLSRDMFSTYPVPYKSFSLLHQWTDWPLGRAASPLPRDQDCAALCWEEHENEADRRARRGIRINASDITPSLLPNFESCHVELVLVSTFYINNALALEAASDTTTCLKARWLFDGVVVARRVKSLAMPSNKRLWLGSAEPGFDCSFLAFSSQEPVASPLSDRSFSSRQTADVPIVTMTTLYSLQQEGRGPKDIDGQRHYHWSCARL
ncbi:hypothetical protein [Mollivirus kamchatka]|nr:hypothetical protein [Mollivirus kamchatka]